MKKIIDKASIVNDSNNSFIVEDKNSSKRHLPKIGLRNIKTALSTTICALIYLVIDRNPTFACIGAVFGMDNSLSASFETGGNRLVGTIIGGFLGMGIFSLSLILPYHKVSLIILNFIGIIALIYISQLFNVPGAIKAGSVVFFIVMLNTPEDQYFTYAINRIIDTGFGVIMSIFINWIHFKLPNNNDNK
ncbi:MAG: aromatic acid exporter family protein [Erysipelotrichaceae bacterium]